MEVGKSLKCGLCYSPLVDCGKESHQVKTAHHTVSLQRWKCWLTSIKSANCFTANLAGFCLCVLGHLQEQKDGQWNNTSIVNCLGDATAKDVSFMWLFSFIKTKTNEGRPYQRETAHNIKCFSFHPLFMVGSLLTKVKTLCQKEKKRNLRMCSVFSKPGRSSLPSAPM